VSLTSFCIFFGVIVIKFYLIAFFLIIIVIEGVFFFVGPQLNIFN